MAGNRMKRFLLITVALLFLPVHASAHLVTTGMGPVYDGVGHLLLTPEDLIPALAVALYAGLRGSPTGRWTLLLFPLSWLLGGIAGLILSKAPVFPIPIVSFLLLGGLIAADAYLTRQLIIALVVAIGGIHGFFNGVALVDGPGISGLIGISSSLFVLVALASAVVVSLQATWTRIAVRVTGSWIAAVGILMLGWFVKTNS